MRQFIIHLLAVLIFLQSNPDASGADLKQARKFNKNAINQFKKGNYSEAVKSFEAAYEAFPKIEILFNIAKCHEKLGDFIRALEYYKKFMAVVTDKKEIRNVEKIIVETEKIIDTEYGRVFVSVEPADAGLFILTGKERKKVSNPFGAVLKPSEIIFNAEKENFISSEIKLFVEKGKKTESLIRLVPFRKTAKLIFQTEQKGTDFFINDKKAALSAQMEIYIEPGKTAITGKKTGFKDFHSEIITELNKDYVVSVIMLTEAPKPEKKEVVVPGIAKPVEKKWRTWAWISFGTSAALAATGVTFHIISIWQADQANGLKIKNNDVDAYNREFDSLKNKAQRNEKIAWGMYGGTLLTASACAVMFLLDANEMDKISFVPYISDDSAVFALWQRF